MTRYKPTLEDCATTLSVNDDDTGASIFAPETTPRKERTKVSFAKMRRHWSAMLVDAGVCQAAGVLLAEIAYCMDMDTGGLDRIPLTEKVWEQLGRNYAPLKEGDRAMETRRRRALRSLGRVPGIVHLQFSNRTGSKYVARKGEWFDKAPPRSVKSASDGTYQAYLRTPWWLERSERRLEVAGYRCEYVGDDGKRCGETKCLDVHHLHYRTLGCEADEDLGVRCRHHHHEAHGLGESSIMSETRKRARTC
jgi:hypothetical protein